MLRKLFLLFCVIQSVIAPISARNRTIDSLLIHLKKDKEDTSKVIHLNKLCWEYKNISSYDTAFRYGNAALQLAEQINFPKGVANAFNNIGVIYYEQGDYEKALENQFASQKKYKEISNKQGIAQSCNNIGNIYKEQGNYDNALRNYFASLKIYEEIGDKKGIAASYNNIGLIYWNQGNYAKALENYFASLKVKEKIGEKKGIAISYLNIGGIYLKQGNYDKSLEKFLSSLKIYKEIGNKQGIAASYNNIGEIYRNQGNYAKALENYFASLKIREEIGDKEGIAGSYINIGSAYMEKKHYAEATSYLLNSLRLFKELGVKDGMMEAYQRLSEVDEKRKDYKNAHIHYQLYSQIKDSIFNEQSSKQIAEMQTKYETEKKDKEIQFQALQLSEQELSLKNNRTLLFIIIISSLLLIAFGWTAFSRYRIKQQAQLKSEVLRQQELRTNAIIETQEQERRRIAQDLHDGIGHKLTTLKINFEKITENMDTIPPEQKIVFEQTENILDETHKEVRTLSHFMMPKALQERELADAVSDLMDQTLANSKIKYQLKNNLPSDLPSTIQVCLYRVLQELLNNILKHAHATEIAVQIFKNKDTVIMMVEDNGKGIQENNNTSDIPAETLVKAGGIGLHNIAGRIHALKGVFTIEPCPVKGTIATVRIPITQ